MNKFTLRFKELIIESGKTQKEIAKDLKRTQQTISNWKVGYNEPNIDDLITIANYFGVCIDYLVGRQDWY